MPDQLLVRDVMRIGVPTCRPQDTVAEVAAQMIEHGWTAVVVMDEEGDARGWLNEQMLAVAYVRSQGSSVGSAGPSGTDTGESSPLTAADVMDEHVPDGPADVPLTAAVHLMADLGVDHLFFMHHAGGRLWPASLLTLRDVLRALAGPEYLKEQGVAAPRPTPMDLFRQRYGLPPKK